MNGITARVAGETSAPFHPRLLLAEDDSAAREILREMLRPLYAVEAVADGAQAWDAAQRDVPDLVLSDVLMPELDGIALVRRLRADARTATVPIILLTASSERKLMLEAFEAGADDFLAKPFSQPELLARLRSHSQLVALRRAAARHDGDERFRLIVESARDYAILTFDWQRRITSWNVGAEIMTGFAAGEMLGQPVDLLFSPEDRDRGVPAHEMREAQQIGRFESRHWQLRRDGTRFWSSGVVMPLRESGPEHGWLKIARDMTAVHEARDERERLLAAERAARQEAQAANNSKDRFLGALSHELRTPLAPVQFALYLMRREPGLPATVLEGMEMIERSVNTEIQLIGDLLDVSRMVYGQMELNTAPLDLHGCIREALRDCQPDFWARGLEPKVTLGARRRQVLGDARRLRQVFCNLLRNAADFTPRGGSIRVRSRNTGQEILVTVADSGIGIPAEALTKIFEPFEQGESRRTRADGGLGLGLAIARAIISAHHGELSAESPGADQGATFLVRLAVL